MFKTEIDFEQYNYTNGAVDNVVIQLPGKQFCNENGTQIGTVVKATRIVGTKVVELEIDIKKLF